MLTKNFGDMTAEIFREHSDSLVLLICILTSLLVSIILLASTPVSILTISLICFESLILFSINFFTLYKQIERYKQKFAKDTLQKCSSDYQKKLNSKFFTLSLTKLRGQIYCLPLLHVYSPLKKFYKMLNSHKIQLKTH
jgi:hypothetical protein